MFSSFSSQRYFLKKRNPHTSFQSSWSIFWLSSSTLRDVVHIQSLVNYVCWAFILIQVLWAGYFPKFLLLKCHELLAASQVSTILRETFKYFHPLTVGTYYPGKSQKICYSQFIDQEPKNETQEEMMLTPHFSAAAARSEPAFVTHPNVVNLACC